MSEATHSDFAISRRNLLTVGGSIAAAAAAGVSLATEGGELLQYGTSANQHLAAAALACVRSGEAGLQHCLAALKEGDATFSSAASRMQEMVLSCGALTRLAVNDSGQVGAMAAAVSAVASDCEQACRQHARHEPLRSCADSCAALVEQCRAA